MDVILSYQYVHYSTENILVLHFVYLKICLIACQQKRYLLKGPNVSSLLNEHFGFL